MIDSGKQIAELHDAYCAETRLEVVCTMQRHYQWEFYITRGFTLDDLVLVCRNMQQQVRAKKRLMASMNFTRLVGNLENFEELLAEFRALQRRPRVPRNRAAVLRATHRPAEPKMTEAQSAKQILKRLELADKLREFRKTL